MSGYEELAKMFTDRNNPEQIAFIQGTVIGIAPLIIQPDGINFTLDSDDLIIPYRLTEHDEELNVSCNMVASIDGINKTLGIVNKPLTLHFEGSKLNDRVAMLSSLDGQKYLVVDREV